MSDTATRLRNVLLGNTPLTNLVGRRVFQARAPQGQAEPYVWINRRGVEDDGCLDSAVGRDAQEEYFDAECWAPDLGKSQDIAAALRTVLHNYYGTFDDTGVAAVMVTDHDDSYTPTGGDGDNEAMFYAAMGVQVSYK